MHEDRKTLDNDSLVSNEMTTMTTKCFYDKMINASNNNKKLLLLTVVPNFNEKSARYWDL